MHQLLQVTVGGLVVRSHLERRHEQDGPVLQPGGLTGWWGRPAGAGGQTPRPNAHGEFDEPVRLGGRVVTVQGWVEGPPLERAAWCDRLSALGADGGRVRISVSENGVSTWAWCRVVGVQVGRATERDAPAFMLTLRCANPRRFGETRRSPRTASLVSQVMENRGNFEAAPRFIVEGPQPTGYRIWGEGNADPYIVTTALAAGVSDVVDFATGTVTRGGALLVGGVTAPVVWTVPAASSRRWEAALSGAGLVTGEITDTSV
jgi:hypothetical protein